MFDQISWCMKEVDSVYQQQIEILQTDKADLWSLLC